MFFFLYKVFEIQCVFFTYGTFQFRLAMISSAQKSPMADGTILDSTGLQSSQYRLVI